MSMTAETENLPDGPCHEEDGCPTETAVLQREWRRLRYILSAPVERGRCANLECVWWGGGAYLAGFNDATAADSMAGTLRERLASVMGSNVEVTGSPALSASPRGLPG